MSESPAPGAAAAFSQAHPPLAEGDAGPAVVHARTLVGLPGPAVFDAPLADAVRQFQTTAGIAANGAIGLDTWAALHPVLAAGAPQLDAVTELQSALGIPADGVFGPQTTAAVEAFQRAAGIGADGIVGPLTYAELLRAPGDGAGDLDPGDRAAGLELSGPAWVMRFPNSTAVADLQPPFRDEVARFLAALQAAGVSYKITSTLRPARRAWLMHYAQQIATHGIAPAAVPQRADIPIQWVHATNAESIAAAQAMIDAYGIRGPVALNSNHISGRAIDMFITWHGTPVVHDAGGKPVVIAGSSGTDDPSLVHVGRSYGVIRGSSIPSDPEHWSFNGH